MVMEPLSVGVDVGTSSIKAVAVTSDDKVLSSCVKSFNSYIEDRESTSYLYSEQDVSTIWSSFVECLMLLDASIKSHYESPPKIESLSFCGQMHGVVLWKQGTHLKQGSEKSLVLDGKCSPLITWQDQRCSPEFLAVLPPSSGSVSSGFGCASLFWLRRNSPAVLAEYDCAGTIMDLIVYVLCNLQYPVISSHNAYSWGYFEVSSNSWQATVLKEADFPIHLLPQVKTVGQKVGKLSYSICGLPMGLDVYVASGDAQSSVASTRIQHHQAVLNIGTSLQMSLLRPIAPNGLDVLPSIHTQLWPYTSTDNLLVLAGMNGGNTLSTFVRMLQQWMEALGSSVDQQDIWTKLVEFSWNDELSQSGPTIVPTLIPERATPEQSGCQVLGLTPNTSSLSSIYQKLCQGIIRKAIEMLPAEYLMQAGVREVLCTGSVFKKHHFVLKAAQVSYDKLNVISVSDVDAAIGCVLLNQC